MRRNWWIFLLGVVLVAATVGFVAYDLGVSHGIARTAEAGAQGQFPPYYYYGWYRPWGFGFGPLLFIVLWFLVFRGLFWGGPWRRRWYYSGPPELSARFDDWHRRAHERMKEEPSTKP